MSLDEVLGDLKAPFDAFWRAIRRLLSGPAKPSIQTSLPLILHQLQVTMPVRHTQSRSEAMAFHVEAGHEVSFSKTVSETDVYMFAGITGDLAPNHVDAVYMANSSYGRRIAHGALLIGYMSTTSTMAITHVRAPDETPVSLGYDRVRFLKPVFLDDTITVTYRIAAVDEARRRSGADIEVHNQDGELVAVAQHILKWVSNGA